MTPLFPTPDHYLYNLIAMTSSEAKRLWRRGIKEHFDNTCVYCGKTYDLSQLTLDHVHPRFYGGRDETSNLVCSCKKCNQEKGTLNYKEFVSSPIRQSLIHSYIN